MIDQPRRPWFNWGRLLDIIAILVIGFVVWKIFIAPRVLKSDANAQPAPHVTYQRLTGGNFNVTDARGKVLFLDFFATWCEPCRLETPLIEAYARQHPDAEVVSVDVGEPRALVLPFAKKHHMQNVVLDPHSVSQGYFQVTGFPTVVVIDPQGRIRGSWSGFNPAIGLAMQNAQRTLK